MTPFDLLDADRRTLLDIRGLLARGLASHDAISEATLDKIRGFDRLIARAIPASMYHDAGAYAQCSFCRRYTVDPNAISKTAIGDGNAVTCDCGRTDGWCGSFRTPGDDARFSLGLPATRDRATVTT